MPNKTQIAISETIEMGKKIEKKELEDIYKKYQPTKPEMLEVLCDAIANLKAYSFESIQFLVDALPENWLYGRNIHGRTPLHIAVAVRSFDCAKYLIKKGSKSLLKYTDTNKQKPADYLLEAKHAGEDRLWHLLHKPYLNLNELMDSKDQQSFKCIEMVYNLGKDLGSNISDTDMLHNAVLKGKASIVEFLLKKGVNPNVKGSGYDESPPLLVAYNNNKMDIMCLLLDYGADIRLKNRYGESPLSKANSQSRGPFDLIIQRNKGQKLTIEEVKALKKNFSIYSDFGVEALARLDKYANMKAYLSYVYNKNLPIPSKQDLDRIYESVLDDNLRVTNNDNTVLHSVAYYGEGWEHVLEWLLNKDGGLVHVLGSNNKTVLHEAITSPSPVVKVVDYLLERGADPYLETTNKMAYQAKPIKFFTYTPSNQDFAKYIQKYRSIKDLIWFHKNNGTIPTRQQVEFIKKIHSRPDDLDLEIKDDKQYTALQLAVKAGKPPKTSGWLHVVEFLIENKANLRVEAKGQGTLLHEAIVASYPDLEVIKLLINKGLDLKIKTEQGFTAFDLAKQKQFPSSVLELLNPEKNHEPPQKNPPPYNPEADNQPGAPAPQSIVGLYPDLTLSAPAQSQEIKVTEPVSLYDEIIDLFARDLYFKSEFKVAFHQLPKTQESYTFVKSLIKAFEEENIRELIKMEESVANLAGLSVHFKIARLFLRETAEQENPNLEACCYLAEQALKLIDQYQKEGSIVSKAPELINAMRYAEIITRRLQFIESQNKEGLEQKSIKVTGTSFTTFKPKEVVPMRQSEPASLKKGINNKLKIS